MMEVRTVGVVGCGLMGSAIAEVSLRAGYHVMVAEIDSVLLEKGLAGVRKSFDRDVGRGKLSEDEARAILDRLSSTTDLEDFQGCDLVIEAAPEKINIKKHIFAELHRYCPRHTILATNTSCLSVGEIAATTDRPDRVLGIHFFNPVQLMRLVELVRTGSTSEETLEAARAYVEKLGKTAVISPDTPGFIVNRLLTPFLLEAMRLLQSGEVTKEDLDRAVRLGLNHPMGPLALGDYIGLDTCLSICEAMYAQFKEERFKPPEMLSKMVDAGETGRKSGRGFYEYPAA